MAERAGVMWFVFGAMGISAARRYGLLVGVITGYVGLSLVNAIWWGPNHLSTIGVMRFMIDRDAAMGALSTLAIIVVIFTEAIPKRLFAKLCTAFGVYLVLQFFIFRHWYFKDGPLMTPTLAAVYLTLCLPFVDNFWVELAFMGTIIATGGHTGLLALGAYITGRTWVSRPKRLPWVISGLLGSATLLSLFKGTGWAFRDQHRLEIWSAVMGWWSKQHHLLFGMGAGVWYGIMALVQTETHVEKNGIYTYGHCEPIQILFELGWVGLSLIFLLYATLVIRSKTRGDPGLTGFLLSLGAASLTMFTWRHEAILTLVIFGLFQCLEKDFRRVRLKT